MKVIFLALGLSACASPAHALEVQLTETKSISLIHFPDTLLINENLKTEKDYRQGIKDFPGLGMNDVPVLDQGQYGTCVTFAATAALDAILSQGDYVSQQCSLELNVGLGKDWWNGAYTLSDIVDPLKQYGVVEKSKCPRQYAVLSASMTVSQYQAYIDRDASDVIKKVNLVYKASADLEAVKRAIGAGHRVGIGFLLDGNSSEAVRGFDVVVNGKKYSGGGWFCKQSNSINRCVSSNAGHEVIIVGYDDVQQLLKIRNSWGTTVGQEGEYYMSYQFFNKMVIDQSEIY